MALETPHTVFKHRINIWIMLLGLALSETQVIYKFIDLGKNGNVAILSLVFSLISKPIEIQQQFSLVDRFWNGHQICNRFKMRPLKL